MRLSWRRRDDERVEVWHYYKKVGRSGPGEVEHIWNMRCLGVSATVACLDVNTSLLYRPYGCFMLSHAFGSCVSSSWCLWSNLGRYHWNKPLPCLAAPLMSPIIVKDLKLLQLSAHRAQTTNTYRWKLSARIYTLQNCDILIQRRCRLLVSQKTALLFSLERKDISLGTFTAFTKYLSCPAFSCTT